MRPVLLHRLRPVMIALTMATMAVSGCTHRNFADPIGEFSTAMAAANGVASEFYAEVNRSERTLYLLERGYDPALPISAGDREFTGVIPQAALDRRLRSLALLTTYTTRLSALAGNDAPDRFAAAANSLAGNFNELIATFDSEGGERAQAYSTLLGQIVGVIGQARMERERTRRLRTIILDSEPQVRALIQLVRDDLDGYLSPLRMTGSSQAVATMVSHYNANSTRMTREQREAELARISAAVDRRALLQRGDPAQVIDALAEAHGALADYARSPGRPADIAALSAAIDLLVARLRPAIETIQALREG